MKPIEKIKFLKAGYTFKAPSGELYCTSCDMCGADGKYTPLITINGFDDDWYDRHICENCTNKLKGAFKNGK